jgi:hypothetical protein
MSLADALALRRQLGSNYFVRRSGIRSPGISPFTVTKRRENR